MFVGIYTKAKINETDVFSRLSYPFIVRKFLFKDDMGGNLENHFYDIIFNF